MKKGFFEIENEEGYDFLENLRSNNKEINALYYLHGICHEFSLALNEIFGYDIVLWVNYDEEIEGNILIHSFNIFGHEGKTYYADVRGITDNIENITEGFDYLEEIESPFGYNNEVAKSILKEIGLSTEIDRDIYEVINSYKSYYTI